MDAAVLALTLLVLIACDTCAMSASLRDIAEHLKRERPAPTCIDAGRDAGTR